MEVLGIDGLPLCRSPNLPEEREGHSLTGSRNSGYFLCGGGNGPQGSADCWKLNPVDGKWRKNVETTRFFKFHSSFLSKKGLLLMGGTSSPYSTEILQENGNFVPSFNLTSPSR